MDKEKKIQIYIEHKKVDTLKTLRLYIYPDIIIL